MTAPVRVGVIGAGLIAQRAHLPAYAESDEAEVVALASGRVEAAREVAGRFGGARVYERWQDLVASAEVEAVDICAPNYLHREMAVAAARAGKHVLVEKPMALTLAEANSMIEAARAAGVTLMVAHNLRYVPLYETVKRLVEEGAIGRPLSARGVFMHAGPDEFWGAESGWFWDATKAGGGSLLDMGIHMIDLLRWFIGRPVVEVSAMTSRMLKPTPFDDNAIVLMRFEGGLVASVQSSWSARPRPDRGLTIHGAKGYLATGRHPSEPLVVHVTEDGREERYLPQVPKASERVNACAHFARCVRSGDMPLTDGQEGRRTLEVALAAYQSAAAGASVRISDS